MSCCAGARGAFVPPFQKRTSDGGAVAAGTDQQDSGLSPKTLEMLTGRQHHSREVLHQPRRRWFSEQALEGLRGVRGEGKVADHGQMITSMQWTRVKPVRVCTESCPGVSCGNHFATLLHSACSCLRPELLLRCAMLARDSSAMLARYSSAIGIDVGAGPDGQLPKPLQTMDPAILELVCAEVVEEGAQVHRCERLPAVSCLCTGAGIELAFRQAVCVGVHQKGVQLQLFWLPAVREFLQRGLRRRCSGLIGFQSRPVLRGT